MSTDFSFSQLLRPVGQMLEPLQVESFSLKVEDGGVAVFADKRETPQPAQNVSLKVSWQIFRRKKSETAPEPQPSSGSLEIHYSHEDIARMDSEGQGKRTGAPGSPEAHTLSQILRAVGAFVDQKQGRLLSVAKDGQDITIEYESALKRALTEKFTVASLYDYWVKMYLRRRERT
jgi:hypothetical protein